MHSIQPPSNPTSQAAYNPIPLQSEEDRDADSTGIATATFERPSLTRTIAPNGHDCCPYFDSTYDFLKFYLQKVWESRTAKVSLFFAMCLVFMVSMIVWITKRNNIVEIAFFGDSLVQNTNRDYQLVRTVQTGLGTLHPDTTIYAYASGHGGNTIRDLRERMDRDILSRRSWKSLVTGRSAPDALVVYWDSDCSDIDETPSTKDAIRQEYLANLRYVLTQLTTHIPHVIVAGPSLYGERPRGQNSKDFMYDNYTAINRNISAEFGLVYLETRATFFQNLPQGWHEPNGYLTYDGEHHNARGAELIAEMFLHAFDACKGLWDSSIAL